ncbi:hypothetical protein C8R45DRAFT_1104396 [Mycena sanguinolenta]|nr:hypothetical protein C8R45DRAFT_1104396 [Mycena sanguinolenta]
MDRAIDLRKKCSHFRILVVGRANAGKTTLLKKVCNSVEDPEIFTPEGEKLDLAVVEGSSERGEHDIENQLIFNSNPQFIFHDSHGFESGSVAEIRKVKDFIAARSATSTLSDQLHAICFIPGIACLQTPIDLCYQPTSSFSRYLGLAKAIPVIAIFTKFDGLINEAYNELRGSGTSIPDAKNDAPERAQTILTSNFIGPLSKTKFRPSDFVQLDDMRMERSSCIELIDKTANALTDDALRLLFVSVQQNNIDLCIYYAVQELLHHTPKNVDTLITDVMAWFPHTWRVSDSLDIFERFIELNDRRFTYVTISCRTVPSTSEPAFI